MRYQWCTLSVFLPQSDQRGGEAGPRVGLHQQQLHNWPQHRQEPAAEQADGGGVQETRGGIQTEIMWMCETLNSWRHRLPVCVAIHINIHVANSWSLLLMEYFNIHTVSGLFGTPGYHTVVPQFILSPNAWRNAAVTSRLSIVVTSLTHLLSHSIILSDSGILTHCPH